jgi:hypothetical protein
MKKLSLIIAVLLAGCGGGGGGGVSLPPVPAPDTQLDAFFAAVSGVVSISSEDADAKEVDSITPTSPDGSEPESL